MVGGVVALYCGSRDGVHGIVVGSRDQGTKYSSSRDWDAGVDGGAQCCGTRDRCSVL